MGFGSSFKGGSGLLKKYDIKPGGGVRTTIKGGRGGLTASAIDAARRERIKREDELRASQEQTALIAANQARNAATAARNDQMDMQQQQLDAQQQAADAQQLAQQAQWDNEANSEVASQGLSEKAQREQQTFDMENDYKAAAMRLAAGDPSGVTDYMNRYGNSKANLEGINQNEDGSYSVIAEGQLVQVPSPDGGITVQREPGKEVGRFASAKDMYTQFFGKVNPANLGGKAKAQKRITEKQYVNGSEQLMESYDNGASWSPVGEAKPAGGGKILPASAAQSLAVFNAMSDSIKDIRHIVQTDSSITGPVQSRLRGAQNIFSADVDYEQLKTKVGKLIETAYAMSGKQISEGELKMLETRFLPSLQQPDASFIKRLDELEGWMAKKKSSTLNSYNNAGYNVTGYRRNQEKPKGSGDADSGQSTEGDFSEPKVDAEGRYWVRINGQLREVEM